MATQYFDNIISERYEQAATMIFFNSQVETFRKLAVNGFIQDKLISYEIVNIKKIADRLYVSPTKSNVHLGCTYRYLRVRNIRLTTCVDCDIITIHSF